ncbi:MAG: leucine-rich repeat domain-containing protein [Paramuribaculum sp.]|nr:leucine-rich repeat domain-containing protein [Paramuribaculum sp.]
MDGDIEYTLTTIRNYAFSSCSALASIEIPNSVTTIGEAAFSNCRNLIEINVDSENQNYSSEDGVLFNKYKSNLIQYPAGKEGSYNIPSTVEAIGDYAFQGCSSLTSVEIPNSVTTIENYAFEDCSSLTSVEIPNSVTTIGTSAFRLCSALTSVEITN